MNGILLFISLFDSRMRFAFAAFYLTIVILSLVVADEGSQ